ncbi:MAG: ABC transporter substrate-binding protein [Deltaproteobacteria bacterium]|nr:ABC transporter substrate-binding protein [Deltaproteobacteria bacterium]
MKKTILVTGWLLLIAWMVPIQLQAGPAFDTVETQVGKILEVLRNPSLKEADVEDLREEKIIPIINEIFDYTELSKRTLGRSWKKLSRRQREEFTDLFSSILKNLYLDRILAYTDEKMTFNKEIVHSETKVEVQSEIATGSKTIPIHYRLKAKSGDWKVYDVVIEGVSLIKNYRSQFRDILKNKTPADLIEILRRKVDKA